MITFNNAGILVSICIPAFNAELWIESTIISAINQTWVNKEIIVVDDGSSDKTYEIAKKFENDFIKVYSKKNSGAAHSRNFAYNKSNGDYIQWLDADDILDPDKIKVQMDFISNQNDNNILHSCTWGYFYYRLGGAKFSSNSLWQDLTPKEWLINHLNNEHFMFPAAWLVSRNLIEKAGLWDERLSLNDDGEYFARLVSHSRYIKFHNEAKCYYRKGNIHSLSRSISSFSKKSSQSLALSVNLTINHLFSIDQSNHSTVSAINALNRLCNYLQFIDDELFEKNLKRLKSLNGYYQPKSFSIKFKIICKVFGYKFAIKSKKYLWQIEIILRRELEFYKSKIYHDKI